MRRRSKAARKTAKQRDKASSRRNAPKAALGRELAADTNEKIALLERRLKESYEQQRATSEVLKVISQSDFDLQSVFATTAENAVTLCEAERGYIFRFDGKFLRLAASYNVGPEVIEFIHRNPISPGQHSVAARAAFERRTVHIADVQSDAKASYAHAMRNIEMFRTVLAVPMLKGGDLVGAILIYRLEIKPFTEKQVALVETFASQAVIAIENARLLNELRQRTHDLSESLEQQTATSNVLAVISRSAGDLKPVFASILGNAIRICEAKFGGLFLSEGPGFRSVAQEGPLLDWWQKDPVLDVRRHPGLPLSRIAQSKAVVHVRDLAEEVAFYASDARFVDLVETAKARAVLGIPMLKDDGLVGAIIIYRSEARPFSDKQIELVTNFAAQAVIAIENARLLNELRQRTDDLSESLEQQTATSEVLKVISSSPGDLEPVFASMLQNAVRICEAKFGGLFLCEGHGFRSVAQQGPSSQHLERWRDQPFVDIREHPRLPLARVAAAKTVVHIANIADDYDKRDPRAIALVESAGARTVLCVPMLKNDELVGTIIIYRTEVRPFSDKQIELVKNFAAQAVIAIENTRLLNELRESLEQQTATSEVLKVISSSPGELEPVFNAMLENAVRICGAKFGILYLSEGDGFRTVAMHDVPREFAEERGRKPLVYPKAGPLGRVMRTRQVAHITDITTEQGYVEGHRPLIALAELGGARTVVAAPMLKDDKLVGAITIYRQDVRPFNDKQIELLTNFAAQAVIAIENTRLLNELRQRTDDLSEALERQTATSEVLQVISSSPGKLEPVFQSMLENAVRICEAKFGVLYPYENGIFRPAAEFGVPPVLSEFIQKRGPFQAPSRTTLGRLELTKKVIYRADIAEDPTNPMAKYGGARTYVAVPMLKEDELVGTIIIYRQEVRPFTEKQIELLQNFASQAVIAIENARLLSELRKSTIDLTQSLEDLRTAQDRLVQTEKLASLGQLTAGIAHEIKNPLNFVNNFSSVSVELIDELREALAGANLEDKLRAEISEIADTLQSNLDKVVQHGKRADSIVKNMLLHSRQGSQEHRPVHINTVVEESLNLAYHGARAEKQGFNITLGRSFDPAAGEVDVFPQEITRVLLNLISNGFYAATKRKAQANNNRYEPTLTATTKNLGDRVEIRIRDNGTGIPPEIKERMFDPFFTTKPAGEGTGLGLSISHDIIVKQHGGSIEVDTQPGEFTEFRIVLPRGAATIAKSGERP